MRVLSCVFVVMAAGACAADPPAAGVVTPFDGFWKPESIRYDGEDKVPDAKQRQLLTLVVKGGEYRMYVAKNAAEDQHVRLLTAALAVDPAAKAFELTVTDGQKKGDKFHGIYEAGGGKLKLCYGPAAKPRPTAFDAAKGADVFCEVWAVEKR